MPIFIDFKNNKFYDIPPGLKIRIGNAFIFSMKGAVLKIDHADIAQFEILEQEAKKKISKEEIRTFVFQFRPSRLHKLIKTKKTAISDMNFSQLLLSLVHSSYKATTEMDNNAHENILLIKKAFNKKGVPIDDHFNEALRDLRLEHQHNKNENNLKESIENFKNIINKLKLKRNTKASAK